jgi:hypothetical protein
VKTPESYEKSEIDKYLKSIGAYVVKPVTFGYGASGHSDRVFCWHGMFGAIEVKREGAKPTTLQDIRMSEVQAAGGTPFWGTAAKVIPEIKAWCKRVR